MSGKNLKLANIFYIKVLHKFNQALNNVPYELCEYIVVFDKSSNYFYSMRTRRGFCKNKCVIYLNTNL